MVLGLLLGPYLKVSSPIEHWERSTGGDTFLAALVMKTSSECEDEEEKKDEKCLTDEEKEAQRETEPFVTLGTRVAVGAIQLGP